MDDDDDVDVVDIVSTVMIRHDATKATSPCSILVHDSLTKRFTVQDRAAQRRLGPCGATSAFPNRDFCL